MTTSRAMEALTRCETTMKNSMKAALSVSPTDPYVRAAMETINEDIATIKAALSAEEIEGLDEVIELAEFRRLNRNMETQRVSLPTRCLDTLLKAARQGRGG